MICDFCSGRMVDDETGAFCLEHELGGHTKCAFVHFETGVHDVLGVPT